MRDLSEEKRKDQCRKSYRHPKGTGGRRRDAFHTTNQGNESLRSVKERHEKEWEEDEHCYITDFPR